MARARNIKPGFFTNETLSELPPLARLLFAGLWTIADRAGRLEDRPKRIKAQLLAYDNCNVDKFLQSLHDNGFILRYSIGEDRFIQVLAWDRHQNPHIKEVLSTIPAPCKNSSCSGNSGASPADSFNLIPDSGFLIPDSLNPRHGEVGAGGTQKQENHGYIPLPPGEAPMLDELWTSWKAKAVSVLTQEQWSDEDWKYAYEQGWKRLDTPTRFAALERTSTETLTDSARKSTPLNFLQKRLFYRQVSTNPPVANGAKTAITKLDLEGL